MDISLFSKCIKDLIVENDRVAVPYLGTFMAEMMPASYSDRLTTIHPPYRKMSFRKGEVSLDEGGLVLGKVVQETGVTLEQAAVELGWCLSRLCSELEGSKNCKLPGLGVMRANARNEFFFVPDDNLDIWPDGLGFESIPIKVSEKMPGPDRGAEMPDQVGHDERSVGHEARPVTPGPDRRSRKLPAWAIVLIVAGALLVLFVAACYLFTEEMSPILDPLLYSKEELELLGR